VASIIFILLGTCVLIFRKWHVDYGVNAQYTLFKLRVKPVYFKIGSIITGIAFIIFGILLLLNLIPLKT